MALSRIRPTALAALLIAGAAHADSIVQISEDDGFPIAAASDPLLAVSTSATRSFAEGASSWSYLAAGGANARRGQMQSLIAYTTTLMDTDDQPTARVVTRVVDDVTFMGPDSTVAVSLSVTTEGGLHSLNGSAFAAISQLGLGSATGRMIFLWEGQPSGMDATIFGQTVTVTPRIEILRTTAAFVAATMWLDLVVPTGVPLTLDWRLIHTLRGGFDDIANSDYGHTATLAIDLPDGVTFTSASGVLLAVPEPAPAVLWALALPWLAWRTRRSRRGPGAQCTVRSKVN